MSNGKQMPRRLLSLLLALVMLFGMVPVTALAAGTATQTKMSATVSADFAVDGYSGELFTVGLKLADGFDIAEVSEGYEGQEVEVRCQLTLNFKGDGLITKLGESTAETPYTAQSSSMLKLKIVTVGDGAPKTIGWKYNTDMSQYEEVTTEAEVGFGTVTADPAEEQFVGKTLTSNPFAVTTTVKKDTDGKLYIEIPVSFSGQVSCGTLNDNGQKTGYVDLTGPGAPGAADNKTLGGTLKITGIEQAKYDVFYYANAEGDYVAYMPNPDELLDVDGGTKLTAPRRTPERKGYTFLGWRKDGAGENNWNFETDILEGDTELYAMWEKLNEDGTAPSATAKVQFVREKAIDGKSAIWPTDVTYTKPADSATVDVQLPWDCPKTEGYTFQGWTETPQAAEETPSEDVPSTAAEPVLYQPGDTISVGEDGLILYAVWEEDEYTITYEYVDDENVTKAKASYQNTQTTVTPGKSVSFDVVVKYNYDPTTMIVTANGQQLNHKSSSKTQMNSTVYNYEFVPTGDTTVVISTVPGKLQYTVTLPESEKFTAAFTDDTNKIKTVEYDGSVSFTVEKKNDNWKVGAVYVNGVKQTPAEDGKTYTISNITENKTVTVEMDEVVFSTVHYVIEGAEITKQVETGTAVDLTFQPALKTGYTFVGWYSDAECKTLISKETGKTADEADVYLYGRYVPISRTIQFDLNEPEAPFSCSVTRVADVMKVYGMAAQIPAAKPADTTGHYEFKGWALSANGAPVYQPGDQITVEVLKNTTLYAVWEVRQYQITFNAGPGYIVHLDDGKTTAGYGTEFKFSVLVDEAHLQDAPIVWANWVDSAQKPQVEELISTGNAPVDETDGSYQKYFYTFTVKGDTAINIIADDNDVYNVEFLYGGLDATREVSPLNEEVYQTQNVGWNDTATVPVAPQVEGYAFLGWYVEDTTPTDPTEGEGGAIAVALDLADAATARTVDYNGKTYVEYDFSTPVKGDLTIYAMFRILEPTVTFEALEGVDANGLTMWEITNITNGNGEELTAVVGSDGKQFKVPYGTDVAFDLIVNEGFDYSQLALAANGYALTQISEPEVLMTDGEGGEKVPTGQIKLSFKLTAVKTNTVITVTGIVRKQITVTYYANAMDDVAGVPGAEKLNYYIEGAVDNSKLNDSVPSRVGYEFKGWATVPAYWDGEKAVYDKAVANPGTADSAESVANVQPVEAGKLYWPGDISYFTADTNLYAVWAAEELGVTLKFVDPFHHETINGTTIDHYYEGDTIHLQASLANNTSAQGTFTFYRQTRGWRLDPQNGIQGDGSTNNAPDEANWVQIGEPISSNSGTATLDYKIADDEYVRSKNARVTAPGWWYRVVFTPANQEGYAAAVSAPIRATTHSKAIAWAEQNSSPYNKLTIYADNDGEKGAAAESMIANNVYWLELPQVKELKGARYYTEATPTIAENNLKLKAGVDYVVEWQYKDTKNDWVTYTTTNTDTVKIEAEYSGYVFRALVRPTANSMYTKAASYNQTANPITLIDNQYKDYLISQETPSVTKKPTVTALIVTNENGALTEEKDVVIDGTKPFNGDTGSHLAQYEGQQIELVATVTKQGTEERVEMGSVSFYRVTGTGANDLVLLDTVPVYTEGTNTGVAKLTVTVKAYDTAEGVKNNVDKFKAVYVENATYETSENRQEVYVKSADFQTPIVQSQFSGAWTGTEGEKFSTSYDQDLVNLEAGLAHTFTLRQNKYLQTDGGYKQNDELYSVIALDGRKVSPEQYNIQWFYSTGDNPEAANGDSTNPVYNTTDNKQGDRYFVRLSAAEGSAMRGTVDSKSLVVGRKLDVLVTVEADDAIPATPVDETHNPDVYQRNNITLRAWVEPDSANAGKLPSVGSGVNFYYMDGNTAVYLGQATLQEESVSHKMFAELATDQLPVDTNGTYRDVEITAIYLGDESFNHSRNGSQSETTQEWSVIIPKGDNDGVENTTVTVYSSVVFNCEDENKTSAGTNDFGIHISKKDGAVAAHEFGVLELSPIYTLDAKAINESTTLTDEQKEALIEAIATLNPTGDDKNFSIQWQILTDVDTSKTDYSAETGWTDIAGETGTTLVLKKQSQDTAYRAKITVTDTARVKASHLLLAQDEPAPDGRNVYYSNVLTTGEANSTVSVSLNTSALGENEEGITEGETVTANIFVSGAANKTPEGQLAVSIKNDETKGNAQNYLKQFTIKNTVNGWNNFAWDTTDVAPGYYTMTVTFNSNTGYATQTITRSLIVRESTYSINAGNLTPTYNGQTQGVTVELVDFDFNGTGVNDAAKRSWTVKYYDKDNNLVEPVQAGTYTAVITLPGSAYWTEVSKTVTFTIKQRQVSIEDVIAQAKVYDRTAKANLLEVILNDAETDQTVTGLPTGNTGVLNGDSIYATAVGTISDSGNAGERTVTVNGLVLGGDDKDNYVWDGQAYTEAINVSRSQVYGVHATGEIQLKQGEAFPAAQLIKMIDQSGREITLGTGKDDYTLTFYYHSDTEIKQTTTLNKLGLYTVIARPNQDNYKGGVEMQFTVVTTDSQLGTLGEPKASTLINITNTVECYGATTGINANTTSTATITDIQYWEGGTTWKTAVTDAGRYLVKVTASTGDVAYGLYTIVKINPTITLSTTDATYNSMEQNGSLDVTFSKSDSQDYYVTYAGDVAIGGNVQKDGNVDEQAPVNAGSYAVTVHTNETANFAAYEISASYTVNPKPLTITADSWQTTQYGAYPDFTASYDGFAAEAEDATPDVWTRDVQIEPEYLLNEKNGGYTNDLNDQVGLGTVRPADALAKNYAITYVNGEFSKQAESANPTLAIHGVQDNNTADTTTVYYGDVIQLYPYGTYTNHNNESSFFTWEITDANMSHGNVTIDEKGILDINGVGEFTVTLSRGEGTTTITTSRRFKSIQEEVQVVVGEDDNVYTGSSQTYDDSLINVYDMNWFEVEFKTDLLTAIKAQLANNTRTNIGTQLVDATGRVLKLYQYRTYRGQFSIHDLDILVSPVGDTHIYGQTRTVPNPAYTLDKTGHDSAVVNVKTASQTDDYNRLDVDGYEILVAGGENINYNVKYLTYSTAPKSVVEQYTDVKLYSTTTKAKNLAAFELNDATVYGDAANVLDWILKDQIDGDTLADFNIADANGVFIAQDYDNCIQNTVTYKAANRVAGNESTTALAADRTATDTNADDNYELLFKRVANTGAENYQLTNADTKNAQSSMTAPTGTVGFIGASATSDNLIEGSANIAQRPVTLGVRDGVKIYWHTPQNQLYTALLSVITANGLAKGHTIKDLDLTLKLTVDGTTYTIDKNSSNALNITTLSNPTATVSVVIGDTNYKLANASAEIGSITLKTIQIEATYTTKTFTNFTVLIKAHEDTDAGDSIKPLTSTDGLNYKIFKKTGDVVDTTTVYAEGLLTYTGRTQSDGKDLCGVFTASYATLPKLENGETYFIQMYEYGVPLVTSN